MPSYISHSFADFKFGPSKIYDLRAFLLPQMGFKCFYNLIEWDEKYNF